MDNYYKYILNRCEHLRSFSSKSILRYDAFNTIVGRINVLGRASQCMQRLIVFLRHLQHFSKA